MQTCAGRENWLLDNAADGHVCNQKQLFSIYHDDPMQIAGATSSTTSPGKGIIQLKLALEDGMPGSTLTLTNVWYMPQCPANLVSQARLNDSNVFYNNENWTLYLRDTRQILGYAPRINNSFVLKTIQNQDMIGVHLTRATTDVDAPYQWPEYAIYKTTSPIKLSTWHARLGHMNFAWTIKYLKGLNIPYTDDVTEDFFCDSCELAKATKKYNRNPQKRASEPFREIHTDMIGAIKPIGFLDERYFFTFTDSYSRFTHVYTAIHKHEWFDHLQTYYSLAQNKSQKSKPIGMIRTDFGTELRSGASDKWMLKEGIAFEPSCPHSQKQNGILERMGRTIMDMTRSTIIGGNIPDDLWPEVVLAMVHVKNVRPTSTLNGKTPHELMEQETPTIDHLRVLGSTVYVLIHQADRKGKNSKRAKFAPRAQRGKLVGYDGKTIYRVFLERSQSIIRVKDLSIHEDAIAKDSTELSYDAIQIADIKTPSQREIATSENQISSPTSAPIPDLKRKRGRPRKDAIKALILKLYSALTKTDWERAANALYVDGNGVDPYVLLAKKLEEVQAYDPQTFAFVTQFDLVEPATYDHAMNGQYAEEWTNAIIEEYNSLIENGTWIEVPTSEIPVGQKALDGKWIFKLKRGPNGEITRFKARWVVKGFQQQYGIDYDETYASVVKPMAFRALFAIAAYHDLDIDQMDVKTAFLYGIIKQLIYVKLPPGFEKPGVVCKLLKGLYGLKQSARLWYERISEYLFEKIGLKRLHADHGIFATEDGILGPMISIWVV